MTEEFRREMLEALIEGRPVFVQENGGSETLVSSLEMKGETAIGFRAVEDGRLIKIEEVSSVSLSPTRSEAAPFESLLIRASHIPSNADEVACQFKFGELHQIENPLPSGKDLPQGALVEIGFARLPPSIAADAGYQLVFYRRANDEALPFPFYVYATDGEYYWQIFIANAEDLKEFRDTHTPDCEVEGLPPANNGIIDVTGEH